MCDNKCKIIIAILAIIIGYLLYANRNEYMTNSESPKPCICKGLGAADCLKCANECVAIINNKNESICGPKSFCDCTKTSVGNCGQCSSNCKIETNAGISTCVNK